MSGILEQLGLDPETLTWEDLAACKNLGEITEDGVNLFFDKYESDDVYSQQIDNLCLSCPVTRACARKAKEDKEEGVWGGVYWNGAGRPDKNRNRHKTDETWRALEEKTGLKLR